MIDVRSTAIDLQPGELAFGCYGCDAIVQGGFWCLFDALDRSGRGFCHACEVAYRGRYDPGNPALMALVAVRKQNRRGRWWHAERHGVDEETFTRVRAEYTTKVRALTDQTYRQLKAYLNPLDREIGPIGETGAFGIDHIAPIAMCFDAFVPEADCAHHRNLACIPQAVNASRGCRLKLNSMIGVPAGLLPGKLKR